MEDTKSKLIKIKKEWFEKVNLGDIPKDNIEEEIFAELDLTSFDIYAKLDQLEKQNRLDWTPGDLKKSIKILQKLVEQRGFMKFKKNKHLYIVYKRIVKTVDLMEKLNKLEGKVAEG